MDTVSLPAYRRALVDLLADPLAVLAPIAPALIALAAIGLILLVVAGLALDLPFPQPATDPVLAPFRWHDLPGNVA
jgi:hypothetical protein